MINSDPLLVYAASAGYAEEVLLQACVGEDASFDRCIPLVRRLMARARPPCALEDCRRLRLQLELDDQLLASARLSTSAGAELRALLSSVVLAAADYSFLALPAVQHFPWAQLACHEAQSMDLAVKWEDNLADTNMPQHLDKSSIATANWLRGLTEVLALPVYETLGMLASAGPSKIAGPLRHLRDNARHWKTIGYVDAISRQNSGTNDFSRNSNVKQSASESANAGTATYNTLHDFGLISSAALTLNSDDGLASKLQTLRCTLPFAPLSTSANPTVDESGLEWC